MVVRTAALGEFEDPLVPQLDALVGRTLPDAADVVADVLTLPETIRNVGEGDHGAEPAAPAGLANRSSCVGSRQNHPTHAPDPTALIEAPKRFPDTQVPRLIRDLQRPFSVQ